MSDQSNRDQALHQFTEYFVKNYPGPDTIIGNPNWHAPKLFRAALRAIEDAGMLSAPQAEEREPVAPHIIEALSYHARERDDLTLDEALDYLRQGWKKVCGRSERELVLQITALLAGAPQPSNSDQTWNEAIEAAKAVAGKAAAAGHTDSATALHIWDGISALARPAQPWQAQEQVEAAFKDMFTHGQGVVRVEHVPIDDFREKSQEPVAAQAKGGEDA